MEGQLSLPKHWLVCPTMSLLRWNYWREGEREESLIPGQYSSIYISYLVLTGRSALIVYCSLNTLQVLNDLNTHSVLAIYIQRQYNVAIMWRPTHSGLANTLYKGVQCLTGRTYVVLSSSSSVESLVSQSGSSSTSNMNWRAWVTGMEPEQS